MLYIGTMQGGPSPQLSQVDRLIDELYDAVDRLQADYPSEWDLDIAYRIDGRIAPLDFSGVRSGSLSIKESILQVQIAVDPSLSSDEDIRKHLLDSLKKAVEVAGQMIRRRKGLDWDTRHYLEMVDAIEKLDPG